MSGQLRGFGMSFDCERGIVRNWYVGSDGVRRWADNDVMVDDPRYTVTDAGKAALNEAPSVRDEVRDSLANIKGGRR